MELLRSGRLQLGGPSVAAEPDDISRWHDGRRWPAQPSQQSQSPNDAEPVPRRRQFPPAGQQQQQLNGHHQQQHADDDHVKRVTSRRRKWIARRQRLGGDGKSKAPPDHHHHHQAAVVVVVVQHGSRGRRPSAGRQRADSGRPHSQQSMGLIKTSALPLPIASRWLKIRKYSAPFLLTGFSVILFDHFIS